MSSLWRTARKFLWFYLGLVVTTLGYSLSITAGVGAGPWDVFHLGIRSTLGIPLFLTIQAVGGIVILVNLTLGIRPTLGMVLNMASVGPFVQGMLQVLQTPTHPVGRWMMLACGVLISGLGTAVYASADLGTGPRDGMMIGLTRRLNLPVGVVKNVIDMLVAIGGWLLGGPLGLGTVVVALTLGHSMALGMSLVRRLATISPFDRFVKPVSLKQPVKTIAVHAN